MSGPSLAIALALFAADPADDISLIDKTPDAPEVVEAAALAAHVVRRRPAAELSTRQGELRDPIALHVPLDRGDTLFIEVPFFERRAPAGAAVLTLANVQSGGKTTVMPWLEDAKLERKGRALSGSAVLILRADAAAPLGETTVGARLTAVIGTQVAASLDCTITVTVVAPRTSTASIELDRRAYGHFQRRAEQAFESIPTLQDYLRLDRVYAAPRARPLPPAEQAALPNYLATRLRADIAAQRLRVAADDAEGAVAEAAVRAIGGLSERPSGTNAQAKAVAKRTPDKNIEAATRALDDLRIDEAEGVLDRLRKSGKLDVPQLATVLGLLGAIYSARGRDNADRTFGQALCLQPKLTAPSRRQPMLRAFEAVRTAALCREPLSMGTPVATRRTGLGPVMVDIKVPFGPDPYALVSGGDIELWGSGGEIIEVAQVRATHGTPNVLEASFEDRGDLENFAGQLLVRLVAKDVSGVALATIGDPSPVPTSVGEAPIEGAAGIPWWVWLVGGVAVAAGTATAIGLGVSGKEDGRGVGPVSVTF